MFLLFLFPITLSSGKNAEFNQKIYSTFKDARELYENGYDTEALIECNKLLKAAPSYIDALLLKGKILLKLKRYGAAYKTFSKILKIKPAMAEAIYYKAIILAKYRRYSSALWELEKYLALAPEDTQAIKIKQKLKARIR